MRRKGTGDGLIVFTCGLLVILVLVTVLARKNRLEIEKLRPEVERYRATYKTRHGATILVPNANPYNLLSVDGGKTWYNYNPETRELKGKADEKLIKHINAMDSLNSPLDLNDAKNIKLLEDAGFKVSRSH